MKLITALFLSTLGALSLSATEAQAQARIGVGAEASLNSVTAPVGSMLFVFDNRDWRIDGLFGLQAGNGLALQVGGRFHYVLHNSERADFAVGAGGFINVVDGNGFGNDSDVNGEIDVQAQIRAFLTPSVAVMASLGMGLSLGDDVTVRFAGKMTGALGIVYLF